MLLVDQQCTARLDQRIHTTEEAHKVRHPAEDSNRDCHWIELLLVGSVDVVNIGANEFDVHSGRLCQFSSVFQKSFGPIETHTTRRAKVLDRNDFHTVAAANLSHILSCNAQFPQAGRLNFIETGMTRFAESFQQFGLIVPVVNGGHFVSGFQIGRCHFLFGLGFSSISSSVYPGRI